MRDRRAFLKLGITAAILEQLARHRPPGLVFDIGSLKTPLRKGLESLRQAGVRVSSVHPMFGPDTDLLSGRHVIHVDVGRPDAVADAQALFASTMAEQVVTTLDDHDRLIAYVLGLSHAINIAFFTALADSGEAAPRLARLSSTTFDAQLGVASLVAGAVLLGTGNSMLYPTLVALVVDRAPPAERGLAIGTLSGAWDVGVFIGSPLVARLVEARGYSAGFLASALAVAVGLAAFLAGERGHRRSPARATVTD